MNDAEIIGERLKKCFGVTLEGPVTGEVLQQGNSIVYLFGDEHTEIDDTNRCPPSTKNIITPLHEFMHIMFFLKEDNTKIDLFFEKGVDPFASDVDYKKRIPMYWSQDSYIKEFENYFDDLRVFDVGYTAAFPGGVKFHSVDMRMIINYEPLGLRAPIEKYYSLFKGGDTIGKMEKMKNYWIKLGDYLCGSKSVSIDTLKRTYLSYDEIKETIVNFDVNIYNAHFAYLKFVRSKINNLRKNNIFVNDVIKFCSGYIERASLVLDYLNPNYKNPDITYNTYNIRADTTYAYKLLSHMHMDVFTLMKMTKAISDHKQQRIDENKISEVWFYGGDFHTNLYSFFFKFIKYEQFAFGDGGVRKSKCITLKSTAVEKEKEIKNISGGVAPSLFGGSPTTGIFDKIKSKGAPVPPPPIFNIFSSAPAAGGIPEKDYYDTDEDDDDDEYIIERSITSISPFFKNYKFLFKSDEEINNTSSMSLSRNSLSIADELFNDEAFKYTINKKRDRDHREQYEYFEKYLKEAPRFNKK